MKSIILFILLLGACKSSKNTEIESANNNQTSVSFEILVESATGGKAQSSLETITTKQELQDIYDLLNRTHQPSYNLPSTDFDKELIVALFMGEKNTGGFQITVTEITVVDKKLVVHYREESPSPTDMVTMAITQPFCIVKINSTPKQIVFNRVK